MNTIKKIICIALTTLITVPALQAHFYAFQEWYNPKTGQVLESWFDFHETLNPAINPAKQRKLLMQRAHNNTIVVAEDMESMIVDANFSDDSEQNKRHLKKAIEHYPCTSPLAALCSHCFINDVDTFNAECRARDKKTGARLPLDKQEQEIASYKDSSAFNTFYDSLSEYADDLLKACGSITHFKPNFMVDARALHTIHSNPHKHIVLAAGAAHNMSIQTVLLQDGWILQKTVLPPDITAQEKDLVMATLAIPSYDHVNVIGSFFHNLNAAEHILNCREVDMNAIIPNRKLAHAPQPAYAQFQMRSLWYV